MGREGEKLERENQLCIEIQNDRHKRQLLSIKKLLIFLSCHRNWMPAVLMNTLLKGETVRSLIQTELSLVKPNELGFYKHDNQPPPTLPPLAGD